MISLQKSRTLNISSIQCQEAYFVCLRLSNLPMHLIREKKNVWHCIIFMARILDIVIFNNKIEEILLKSFENNNAKRFCFPKASEQSHTKLYVAVSKCPKNVTYILVWFAMLYFMFETKFRLCQTNPLSFEYGSKQMNVHFFRRFLSLRRENFILIEV